MSEILISADGLSISKKDYIKLMFESHVDEASWLSSFSSKTLHYIIQQSDFSPSLCNRLFITKDLIDPEEVSFQPSITSLTAKHATGLSKN